MNNFLVNLTNKYAKQNLDLKKALDIWNSERFSAEDIQNIIHQDIGEEISLVFANFLQRSGKTFFEKDKVCASALAAKQEEINSKLANSKLVKVTPEIRAAIEKTGHNKFKSRYGSVEWSIVMIEGQPHLARREQQEMERQEKLADKECDK
jgi:hypothetical protein